MSGQEVISATYHLRALSDIWTGSVKFRKEVGCSRSKKTELRGDIVNNRLITTGLLGSIRWWFEVLVRGLGGYACDPTRTKCTVEKRCVVCELFGCTRWARKFAFAVLDNDIPRYEQLTGGNQFKIRFTALRQVCIQEWALLELTVRLIAKYGAIGGRTINKPSEEYHQKNLDKEHQETESQEKDIPDHHADYGLIKFLRVEYKPHYRPVSKFQLQNYIQEWPHKPSHNGFEWASLDNFWCVNGHYLTRLNIYQSTFNRVVGLHEPKNQSQNFVVNSNANHWLAGISYMQSRTDGRRIRKFESKKIFSFKKPPRTFGFRKPGIVNFGKIRQRLERVWNDFDPDKEFLTGKEILEKLLAEASIS